MTKVIKVWDGSVWQPVGVEFPYGYITINGSQVNLGDSVSISTGPVSQAVSSNITLSANYKYFVNTSSARTLTLPPNPSLGDEIYVFDASGTAATYNITINRNSNLINGLLDNFIIDVNGGAVSLIFTGSTYGWRVG